MDAPADVLFGQPNRNGPVATHDSQAASASQSVATLDRVGQIAIVGTGLLGGSIGLALKAAGYKGRVIGVARRSETARRALDHGCVDSAVTDLAPAVLGAGLVILAVPLGGFPDLLRQLGPLDHHNLVVSDVGSTKQFVLDQARELLPSPTRFVGAHPMAGGERRGPGHASADLFRDKPCILTPEADTDPTAVELIEALWVAVGMRLIRMSAAEHDRQAALISHLPHVAAVALVDLAAKHDALGIASTGFRDATRVAGAGAGLWADILTTNRQSVVDATDHLIRVLTEFRGDLEHGDDEKIRAALTDAKQIRDRWAGRD